MTHISFVLIKSGANDSVIRIRPSSDKPGFLTVSVYDAGAPHPSTIVLDVHDAEEYVSTLLTGLALDYEPWSLVQLNFPGFPPLLYKIDALAPAISSVLSMMRLVIKHLKN